MLYGTIVVAVLSALRIALFSAFDATRRPPDIWEPGEHFANSTAPCIEAPFIGATDFGIPALLVLTLVFIPPPPSVTVIAIHPSEAHSSLGHTFQLGSLFQAFHCAYEAPQFVSAHPSRCVAFLKPTPASTAIYVTPTPVIPSTERRFPPSVTWSTGLHWRVWTMVVSTFLRIVPCLQLVAAVLEAIAIFWLVKFCVHRALSGVTALISRLLRALKGVVRVSAAPWSTAWFQLVQVNVTNELKPDISVYSLRLITLLHFNMSLPNGNDLLWTIAIGPEPLPYTMAEDVEDVERFILRSESTNLPRALSTESKVFVAALVSVPACSEVKVELDPANIPLPFDADIGIALNPADVPLPSGADIGIELDPTMVPLPFDADVGIALDPAMVPLPLDADIGIELDPTTVPLPFDADVGIALDPAMVPLPLDADIGIELDPTTVPLPFDADIGIALDPAMVPLPLDADIGIELDPTTVPLPFDADVGIELDASSPPINAAVTREGSQNLDNETIELELTEASSITDTDGSLEHSLLGLKPIAAVEESLECHSVRTVDSKNDTVNDNQDIASDSGESTLVDSVDLNERLSVCSLKLHALNSVSGGICKSTLPTASCTTPTELGPILASAADHEDSTKTADQEALRTESSTMLYQDVEKEASSATSTPSPTLASESSIPVASSSVPSSSDSSSLSASKGKDHVEEQPCVLDDATSEQDTGAGQDGENPAPKKKQRRRTTRGQGRRINNPNIILEVVGEGSSQFADTENVERPQASGSGLLPSQRAPPTETLAAAGTNATSVQHSRSYPGPQASGSSLSSSRQHETPLSASEGKGKGRAEEQPSVLDDATSEQDTGAGQEGEEPVPKKKITRETNVERPQASGSRLLPSQRDSPAKTLAATSRAPPASGSSLRSSHQHEPPAGTPKTREKTPAQKTRLRLRAIRRQNNARSRPNTDERHSQGQTNSGHREWHHGRRDVREERDSVHQQERVRERAEGRGSMHSAWRS